jgi:site-specific recombinase XerD
MAKMGLRVGEVAGLTLEDINWRQGIIQLKKTKGRYWSSLPLISEVGEALAAYLQKGRPHTKDRGIFVTHSIPVGRALTVGGLENVIYRAFNRSGLSVPFRSPHVLRHTFATHLLKKSAKLKEIADVLRHRSIETTKIYAKVDLKQLAEVALPWPEVKNHEVQNTVRSYRRLYRVPSQTRIWHDRRQETPLSVCPIRR